MSRQLKSRRSFFASIEAMERREVLTGAPLAFQSGAAFSHPTQIYEFRTGSSPNENLVYVGSSTVMTSTAIDGNPIDFNNDGKSDVITYGSTFELIGYGQGVNPLVACNRGPSGTVMMSTGSNFDYVIGNNRYCGITVGRGSYNLQSVAVLDVNSDGYDDFINLFPGANTADTWLFNPVTGQFDPSHESHINFNVRNIGTFTMRDVNGDKLPDMLLPDYGHEVQSSNPTYELSGYSVFLAKPEPDGSWKGGFEHDPVATITLSNPIPQLRATWLGFHWFENVATNNPGQLADVTGDGLPDMIVPETNGLTIFPNPGNGQFTQASGVFVASTTGHLAANIQVGDLNGDGKLDIVSSPNALSDTLFNQKVSPPQWTANNSPVSIYLNTRTNPGEISFAVSQYAGLGSGNDYNGALALADFNQDGILDLAIGSANWNSTLVAVATGNGSGGFDNYRLMTGYSNAADTYYPNLKRGIFSIGIGDYNNDGQLDISTSAYSINAEADSNDFQGIVGVALNNTFANPSVTPATLSVGQVGKQYSQQLDHTGGNPALPYSYALNHYSFALPAGLTLSPTGLITGTPQQSGNVQILVDISQPSGMKGSSYINILIEAGTPAAITPGILPNAVAGVAYNQQLTNQAGPSTWAVTGGQLPPGLTLSSGGLLSGIPSGIGQYPFQVTSTGGGFQSSITYNMIVQAAAAPVVTNLARYGYHGQPTFFVVSYSQAMEPKSAANTSNYQLVMAGRDGIFGTRDDLRVAIKRVAYNSANQSSLIEPVQRALPLHQKYRLTIIGTPTAGVQNEAGTFLGGQGVGAPGTNYVTTFDSKALAGPSLLMEPAAVRTRQIRIRRN